MIATQTTGRLQLHPEFGSRHLGNHRTVRVWLPPGYFTSPAARYPVLYLHDGQNVFEDATAAFGVSWAAGQTADRLTQQGRIRPVILVGIDNTPERMHEYTAFHDARQGSGGKGDLYASFVLEEVKPFIEATYRVLPGRRHTAVAGSSLGGLVSLTMALKHHGAFALCGVLSPSLWWAKGRVLEEVQGGIAGLRRMRFWVCMGTREGARRGHVTPHVARARALVGAFDAAGLVPGRDYCYWEVAGGEHNEAAWAARFDKLLLYFFGW